MRSGVAFGNLDQRFGLACQALEYRSVHLDAVVFWIEALEDESMDPTEKMLSEGSDITQAYIEADDGRILFTGNGKKFWWPKFRYSGVDPRNIKTKVDLQYAVRRVAVTAFRETADESETDLRTKRFMSPSDRAALKCLTASPDDLAAAVNEYEKVINDTK